jgi:hypothetical protein
MEDSRVAIAVIVFLVLVVGVNAMMYGVVRGIMRGGKNSSMNAMMNALNPTQKKKDDQQLEELRRTVQELSERKKQTDGDPEP